MVERLLADFQITSEALHDHGLPRSEENNYKNMGKDLFQS